MAGSTTQAPMKVEQLIAKLKLLPMDMKIEITTETGKYYVQDLIIDDLDKCNIYLKIIPNNE